MSENNANAALQANADSEKKKKWRQVSRFTIDSADVESHIPLLRKILATKNYGPALSYDEKFAAGLLGLVLALERFEPGKGVKLAYWISFQIDCSIRMDIRTARRARKYRDSDADVEEQALQEVAVDEREQEEREKARENLRFLTEDAIENLPARDKKIVTELYWRGRTQEDLARELGVTQSYVSKICTSALNRVRREVLRRLGAEE